MEARGHSADAPGDKCLRGCANLSIVLVSCVSAIVANPGLLRYAASVIVRLPTSRSDSSSLGLRRRSARPPGPPAPGHRQAGARAKRPVLALMLSYGLGTCGAPASQPQCRACDVEVLTRRNPLRLVAVALEEDACSSSRRSPLRLVAVALEEDAALATHPAAPVPPVGHPGAGRRAPLCPVAP